VIAGIAVTVILARVGIAGLIRALGFGWFGLVCIVLRVAVTGWWLTAAARPFFSSFTGLVVVAFPGGGFTRRLIWRSSVGIGFTI
jgi:hypothetical protein